MNSTDQFQPKVQKYEKIAKGTKKLLKYRQKQQKWLTLFQTPRNQSSMIARLHCLN